MGTVVALDASPVTVLRSLRGEIVAARRAYPGVLHVEVRDSNGGVWRLATQDADYSPPDPGTLVGRTIDGAAIDERSGELRCTLSGGVALTLTPGAGRRADGDPPSWELIAPDGVVLEFGPGLRWQIFGEDAPPSRR